MTESGQPKISIVMPVLNGETHLRESIDSLLDQTFADFELIIINDGSTDATPKIIQEYMSKDSRVRTITHSEKQGLAPSINDGIRAARASYIARLDGDDIALPERLQTQYDFLESHGNIALVGGGYAAFNEQGHRLDIYHPSSSLHLAWSFMTNTRFCHPSVLYRKDAAESVGLYPKTGAEDFAFFSRLVRKYPCVNLHQILIRYREHSTNYSITAKPEILKSVQEIYRENFAYYRNDLRGAEAFYSYHTRNTLYFKDWFLIRQINASILRRARQQYRISIWSGESISLMLKLEIKNLRALIGTFIRHYFLRTSS